MYIPCFYHVFTMFLPCFYHVFTYIHTYIHTLTCFYPQYNKEKKINLILFNSTILHAQRTHPLYTTNTHYHHLRHRKSHAAAPGAALFGVSTKIEIKYGKVATLCGMEPINLLFCKYNVCRLVFPAKKVGMHPVNELA